MPTWISDGIEGQQQGTLEVVYRKNEKGEEELIAQGYEIEGEIKQVSEAKVRKRQTKNVYS